MTKAFDYFSSISSPMKVGAFELNQKEKESFLLPRLKELHEHHYANSSHYQSIVNGSTFSVESLSEFPFIAIKLFKQLSLSSIEKGQIHRVLQSSGTSSQVPARVFLDKETSAFQSKVLVNIMQNFIGKSRLPMLIIDSPTSLNSNGLSARAAGIQGMSIFGRNPVYALNDDMSLNIDAINDFASCNRDEPVLIFGFTFMVWLQFVQAILAKNLKISLPEGILIHSGGWKKLEHHKVSNQAFKESVEQACGIKKVHNFYGMAEQVGSVFVECEHGHLHAPLQADIIIRNPKTLEVLGEGEAGLIQLLSVLPHSYPGHSILTEDLGELLGVDDCLCGRKGKYFKVNGRLPKTEIRGCSDTGDSH